MLVSSFEKSPKGRASKAGKPDWRGLRVLSARLEPNRLAWAALQHDHVVDQAIAILNDAFNPAAAVQEELWACDGLWGPYWPGHPFGGPTLLNTASLTEPQVTRELAWWLNASVKGGGPRARAFLKAMTASAANDEADDWAAFIETASINTEAEIDPTAAGRNRIRSSDRRLDLFFTLAAPDGIRRHVIVEAKLEAPLSPGQLSGYFQNTRRLQRPLHVFLGVRRDPALKRNPKWAYCSWRRLLALWEIEVAEAGDDDLAFRFFRSELFRTIRRLK
ncbi:PD-(D/E)XK nuclease family protein [Brevundimonas bullata]